MLFSLCHSCI
uniref:Uncharacterized protein n=1 Tax=Arundo donax TaxID=35708 RepID=A0A0A9FGV3_ARUDO